MAVKHKLVDGRDPKDEARLKNIILDLETIQKQKKGMLETDRVKIVQKLVDNLGLISIPSTPEVYARFMSKLSKIKEILTKAVTGTNMITSCLKAFYKEISNHEKKPSPTLSIILYLVEVIFIPSAVRCILATESHFAKLEQALFTLCDWLSKWTFTPKLGLVVLEFIRGLEKNHQYEILIEVTLTYIERLFLLIILPDTRKNIGPVVFHMLTSMQQSPEAFHKIIPHIDNVSSCLLRENSESSRLYLQNIVDICMALMEHFPDHASYEQLRSSLQPHTSLIDYKQTLVNHKSWFISAVPLVQLGYSSGKVGLNNLGNTCYMNSVLQALFMTKTFRNDVLQLNRSALPLFSKLQMLFALLQFSEKQSLSPNEISAIARPPGFHVGVQHDSSEFLGYLLDILHEQEGSIYNLSDGENASTAEPALNTTVVKKIFGGKILTSLKCNKCDSRSERADTFRDLPLSFPSNMDNQSVQALIDYYLQPEDLCGDNQYYCEACGGLTDGERRTRITLTPPRLVLTLKHFRYDPETQLHTKILQKVNLDNTILLENAQYQLYAVVVHCGSSVDSGHYYTYAKDDIDWYKFNDCSVIKTETEELRELKPPEVPYILFYSRKDYLDPEELNQCDLPEQVQQMIIKDNAESDADSAVPEM